MAPETSTKAEATISPPVEAAEAAAEAVAEAVLTPLTSAPPPWHSVAALGLLSSVFAGIVPSWESVDRVAKVETFTNIVFPEYMDVATLAYVRLYICLSIAFTSFYLLFIHKGWDQISSYMTGTKLIRTPNKLSGIKTMFPFTSVSWNLLGLSFGLNTYICAQGAAGRPVDQRILRAGVVFWEMSAPFTLLVAAVVRYAIWPAVLRAGSPTFELKAWKNIMMHNMNVLFALMESACMGGLPVLWSHISFALLVGILYVLFSWTMAMRWNTPDKGPQFIYFFFDTTLPGYTPTLVILILFAVFSAFYGIFCTCEFILELLGGGVLTHLTFVAVVCACVMRFRD